MPAFNGQAVAAVFLLAMAAPVAATGLPNCGETEKKEPRVYKDEADEHRLFERALVSYPSGTDLDDVDEFASVTVRVDASGRPTCFVHLDGHFIGPRVAQKLRAAAQGWRYRPFERDGRAVPALVHQRIDVQILPGRTADVPPVRAEDTSVTLVRAGCFWQCAEYAITVRGDGWVGYRGLRYVAIKDDHAWKIPEAEAAPLLALAGDPGLWAAETDYRATVHDAETIMVRVDAGGQRKQTILYPASHPAAPIAVRRLAEAIVQRTGVHRWVYLSDETIDALQKEAFDFTSPAGRDLLVRSFHHKHRLDEAAILRLLELGASAETVGSPEPWTVLDIALRYRRPALVEPLIESGVLLTDGRPDQGKIDSAFRAAIRITKTPRRTAPLPTGAIRWPCCCNQITATTPGRVLRSPVGSKAWATTSRRCPQDAAVCCRSPPMRTTQSSCATCWRAASTPHRWTNAISCVSACATAKTWRWSFWTRGWRTSQAAGNFPRISFR
jgi:hypothetical protein